ncbi:endonuclease/exonuclease/phosphatase family protein [Paenibacillus yanchengensis]|uniref:Endonuclease/exonuclease/phosphatase family protein n=1 Tax=Paenibacillus yanchengensis TaxID=2035833 RepID=A0ABW4YIN9_9BACL
MQIRVMSFNIRTKTPHDGQNAWSYRCEQLCQLVEHSGADMVGTQEGLLYMLEDMERLLPDYKWYGQCRSDTGEDEHCAIFYQADKWKLVDQGTFWLSETPEVAGSLGWGAGWPRICSWITVESTVDTSKKLHIYNLHLDVFSGLARYEGMQYIWSIITKKRQQDHLPFILTGDFNDVAESATMEWLHQATMQDGDNTITVQDGHQYFYQQSLQPGNTFHGFEGGFNGEPIDYIFASSDLTITSTEIRRDSVKGLYPSDHYPVVCTIEL